MTKPPLVPCVACQRHVRAGEPTCPFCGESGPKTAPPLRVPRGRLNSLLVMTFHAAAVTAVTGCGGDVAEPPVPPGSTGGAAGHAGAFGTGASVSTGGVDNTAASGGRPDMGTGGTIDLGTGGDGFPTGGAVSIYRATPKG